MFRKLKQHINNAFTDSKLQTLTNMGFDPTQSRNALDACDGNVERATELLLGQTDPTPTQTPTTATTTTTTQPPRRQQPIEQNGTIEDEDEMLQRAIRESLTTTDKDREAMSHAGQAAMARAAAAEEKWKPKTQKQKPKAKTKPAFKPKTPTEYYQPPQRKLNLPPKLQNKTKEEQILRCVGRLSPRPRAVDTILIALRAIRDDPSNQKYRTVDKSTSGFRETLENVPGAEDLLLAVNFRPRNGTLLVLNRSEVDAALLWMAISALEQARESEEYRQTKERMEFEKNLESLLRKDERLVSEEEQIARFEYMRKLSTEPDETENGALLYLHLTSDIIKKRKFNGDDQLLDVLNWIGTMGSEIRDKIVEGEWCLVDMNRVPPVMMDCGEDGLKKTLQWVGCWPSGRLEVRLSGEGLMRSDDVEGATRGLGAVSM